MSTPFEDLIRSAAPAALPSASRVLEAREAALTELAPSRKRGGSIRRVRPRRVALALSLGLFLVAAPAVAIVTGVVSFDDAEPATPLVQKRFEELFGAPAPAGMDPRALPLSTRKVTEFRLASGTYGLWVAPTAGGGFCREFEGLGGGCSSRQVPTAFVPDAGEVRPWLIHASVRAPDQEAPADLVGAAVLGSDIALITIDFEDGTSLSVRPINVLAPIEAAFFLVDVPPSQRSLGHRPIWITARDGQNKVTARTNKPLMYVGANP